MKLDIKEIPFSRFGSYFCISEEKDSHAVYIRDVHGGDDAPSKLFQLDIVKDGVEMEFEVRASEVSLSFYLKDQSEPVAEIIIPEEDELHFEVQNVELRLRATKGKYDSLMELEDGMYEYHIYPKELKLMIMNLNGEMVADAPWNIIGNDYIDMRLKNGHFVIESYRTVYQKKEYLPFRGGKDQVEALYKEWFNSMRKGYEQAEYLPSLERASYITWSSVVHPVGALKDYAMYMSKLWMYNIWSWDNCFNALNLGEKYPELSFAQLKIFMDTQDISGAYPDFVNDKFISYNCIKPPIFAYIYEQLMEKNDYFKDEQRLRMVYESTKKVMTYYEEYRTFEGRLPHYKHGNDSGWDNASLFHVGMPVEAPDLASFLIRSFDILSSFAERLGEKEEAEQFKNQADTLFNLLLERLYDTDGFFGRVGKNGEKIEIRSSLILRLPIIIGYRLDKDIMDCLVSDLEGSFETKFGLATEGLTSNYYRENGYWLGPIWAPVTYLFIHALKNNGYEEVGNRLRDKFLDLTLTGGMAENFDPLTGKGLVDTSFTWTSSVFLLLLDDQLRGD
ncbi:trehalase family glycosidase [Neobacillus sp. 179-C4.2 HS]|uniref:Trehalase family glycosidase n=1 Tax=Neobacillus driksii TaxID=3035913 RepID=A0ABV4YZT1_9BACI|nr:trehalase family glycosidase [Neobacillus sp. 179.-C4.2 HS]MDP5196788.1 trehalase family glycosidase [Neobacillus sp. 179.-C4.2 HS]